MAMEDFDSLSVNTLIQQHGVASHPFCAREVTRTLKHMINKILVIFFFFFCIKK